MKRNYLITLLLAFFSLSILYSFKPISINDEDPTQDDTELFWFTITVRSSKKNDEISLGGQVGNVEKGDKVKFDKALWKALTVGKVKIGPFTTKEEAQEARKWYIEAEREKFSEQSEEGFGEIFWFYISVKGRMRSKVISLEEAPGMIQQGKDSFITAINEGMNFGKLAIGPFRNETDALRANKFFERNED